MKLFMLLLGNMPPGRNTEQHDVFFAIGGTLASLKSDIINFWPEAPAKIHIDAWREINFVDGHKVSVVNAGDNHTSEKKLFFLNLGGYKQNEFEEFHYKMIVAATDKGVAVQMAKQVAFYKHYNLKGAESHIDEKYGVDVDDLYAIEDILTQKFKQKYKIILQKTSDTSEDEIHLGYLLLSKL
ncbi:MAG: DUF1543 domain-containing protein [Bacteroidetes bacterium]|nr:DUF1543 domain-containing protein [Bacteroidota bacterium]